MTSVMTDYIHVSDGGEVSFIPGEMTDNRTTELLPCPFCGGEAHICSDYSSERDKTLWNLWHECHEHDGKSRGYGLSLFPWFENPWYDTEAEAIAAWNTRAELGSGTCEYCKDGTFDGQMTMMSNHGWQVINYCPNCGKAVER